MRLLAPGRQLSLAHTICRQFHFWTMFDRSCPGCRKVFLFWECCGNGLYRELRLHVASQKMIEGLFAVGKCIFNRSQLIDRLGYFCLGTQSVSSESSLLAEAPIGELQQLLQILNQRLL